MVTHIQKKKRIHNQRLRVAFLVKIGSTVAVARILGATRNLQLCNFGCVLAFTQLESE